MKYYLVTSDYGQWDNIFIVLAKDAKGDIEFVFACLDLIIQKIGDWISS